MQTLRYRWSRLVPQGEQALSAWVLMGLLLLFLGILHNEHRYNSSGLPWPYSTDALGYYAYLPAVVIHRDLDWAWTKQYPQYGFSENISFFGPYRSPYSGRWVNKYGPGPALLHAPFFLIAHAFVRLSGAYAADGFSAPYRLAGALTGILWGMIGLLFVRRALRCYLRDSTVALTLLLLTLGTNLLHYTVHEPGMVHVYAFAAMAMVLYYSIRWHQEGGWPNIAGLALGLGLSFLLRPSNALVILVPLFWDIDHLRSKLQHIRRNAPQLLAGIVMAFLICLPQLLYWKLYGGRWLFYSYGNERFLWTQPIIGEVLFGYHKGWFLYTPAALLMLAGLVRLHKIARPAEPGIAIYTLLNLYVVSCWWNWWYGGSFGMRAFIEMTAILSLPLAVLIEDLRATRFRRLLLALLMSGCIVLNLFQTYQYKKGIIHWAGMTKAVYWKVFGRINIPPEELERIHRELSLPDESRRQP